MVLKNWTSFILVALGVAQAVAIAADPPKAPKGRHVNPLSGLLVEQGHAPGRTLSADMEAVIKGWDELVIANGWRKKVGDTWEEMVPKNMELPQSMIRSLRILQRDQSVIEDKGKLSDDLKEHSFLNFFQNTEELQREDHKGIREILKLQTSYLQHLVGLYSDPKSAKLKKEQQEGLKELDEHFEGLNKNLVAAGLDPIKPYNMDEKKDLLALYWAQRDHRKSLQEYDPKSNPKPNSFSTDIYNYRDMIAGIRKTDWLTPLEDLSVSDAMARIFDERLHSQVASKEIFRVTNEMNNTRIEQQQKK